VHPDHALLEGLDGVEKMSKSKNNYIGISERGQHHVRQADEHQRRADVEVLHLAELPPAWPRSSVLKAEVAAGPQPEATPRWLLAKEITTASTARRRPMRPSRTSSTASKGGVPDDIPEVSLPEGGAGLGIGALLKRPGWRLPAARPTA
jgi:tyrosyl-tRNA synthetase